MLTHRGQEAFFLSLGLYFSTPPSKWELFMKEKKQTFQTKIENLFDKKQKRDIRSDGAL